MTRPATPPPQTCPPCTHDCDQGRACPARGGAFMITPPIIPQSASGWWCAVRRRIGNAWRSCHCARLSNGGYVPPPAHPVARDQQLTMTVMKGSPVMKTRDEAIRDLADHAGDQCEALANKMTAVIDGEDDEGEDDAERLCGIASDKDGRPCLIFAEPGVTDRRTVVYVDAILALAKLLSGEVPVRYE